MTLFKILYWAGVVGQIIIRMPYQKTWKAGAKTEQHVSRTEQTILGLLAFTGLVLPLIYTFTPWLGFADYHLPLWLGWLGLPVLICALYLFWRAHHDLSSNWSPSLEIFKEHTLVTSGIYKTIRHPMYASQLFFVTAQLLLLQNWLAGPPALIVFILFYQLRTKAEEKMMLETFGEPYREYMGKTGGVIPKF